MTAVIPCLGVSWLLIFISCNVFKLVCLELLPTPLNIHTSLLSGRLSIGCLLNTIPYSRLPCWCKSSNIVAIQNILRLSLNTINCDYNTYKSQADGVFLEVSHFVPSVYKSSKHFGLTFAYDSPKIWNDMPLLSTHSEKSSKPVSLNKHIHPNFSFSQFLSMAPTLAMSQANDYSFLLFWYGMSRVCL